MGLGVSTGPFRGKPLNGWVEADFPVSKVFSPSWLSYFLTNQNTGELYAFGYNLDGKLGLGLLDATAPKPEMRNGNEWIEYPSKTGLFNVVKMVGGTNFVIALDSSGSLYGAGRCADGELGIGIYADKVCSFTSIDPSNTYKDVASGPNWVLAIRSDGRLFGWGNNTNKSSYGTYTDSAIKTSPSPVPLGKGSGSSWETNWVSVGCTDICSLALNSSGEVYGRGENVFGDDDTSASATDFWSRCGMILGARKTLTRWKVLNNTYSSIECGSNFVIANSSGTLYAWGADTEGQFGMGYQQMVMYDDGPKYFYKDSSGMTTSKAVNPTTGLPNSPWLWPYWGLESTRYTIEKPSDWDTYHKGELYKGSDDMPYLRGKNHYTVALRSGSYSPKITPRGVIICVGEGTFFLTGGYLYACGFVSLYFKPPKSQNYEPFLVAIGEDTLHRGLQGSINEFDISKYNNGVIHDTGAIIRVGNKAYVCGNTKLPFYREYQPQNGALSAIPISYVTRNLSVDLIQPVAP